MERLVYEIAQTDGFLFDITSNLLLNAAARCPAEALEEREVCVVNSLNGIRLTCVCVCVCVCVCQLFDVFGALGTPPSDFLYAPEPARERNPFFLRFSLFIFP